MATDAATPVPAGTDPLQVLLAVQDLDTAIGQLRHRRANLPERNQLAAVQAALGDLATRMATVEAARAELTARQADLERRIAAATERRQVVERRFYAARGAPSRDLQAMDEELHHLAERQSELEDAELEVMVEQEPLDTALLAFSGEREELGSSAEALVSAAVEAETVIDHELSDQVAARADVAATLPPELRDRYESLRARMGGTGAARLVGNRCSGCHLELPSMEMDRIRRLPPGAVVTCDQCGRILVPSSPPPSSPPPSSPPPSSPPPSSPPPSSP